MSKAVTKVVLAVAVLLGVGAALVRLNQPTLPSGPVPIVWDGEVCAHCKMHVGDPRFAAQLQADTGDVLSFDDPGCLFDYVAANDVSRHALYFRDSQSDGWLAESEVGFVSVDDSPMGYGIAAVPKTTSGARGLDWAEAQVQARPHHRGGM